MGVKWNSTSCKSIITLKKPVAWVAPPSSKIKCVDTSYNPILSRSTIGGVLRNDKGHFLCVLSCSIPPKISRVEVLAINRAIQISLNCDRFKSYILEIGSDSFNAVQ